MRCEKMFSFFIVLPNMKSVSSNKIKKKSVECKVCALTAKLFSFISLHDSSKIVRQKGSNILLWNLYSPECQKFIYSIFIFIFLFCKIWWKQVIYRKLCPSVVNSKNRKQIKTEIVKWFFSFRKGRLQNETRCQQIRGKSTCSFYNLNISVFFCVLKSNQIKCVIAHSKFMFR